MVKILCVAEKPSIAESMAKALAAKPEDVYKRKGRSPAVPVFECTSAVPWNPKLAAQLAANGGTGTGNSAAAKKLAAEAKRLMGATSSNPNNKSSGTHSNPGNQYHKLVITSVCGHVYSTDFGSQYRNWNSCDPEALFDAPVERQECTRSTRIPDHIKNEVRVAVWKNAYCTFGCDMNNFPDTDTKSESESPTKNKIKKFR
jgi:DNA topoisomerase IA